MNRVQRPTIITIAEACGVTDGTVSRALRNDPRVADETRRRIQEAAVALGYRPHANARGLKDGRSGAMGIFCEPGAWVLYNYYFGRLMAGLAQGAEDDRVRVVVYLPTQGPEPEGRGSRLSGLDALTEGRVDAGVVLGGDHWDHEGLAVAKASGMPVLLLAPDSVVDGFDQVLSGLEERMELAAQALREAGRRKLGWLGLYAGAPHDRQCLDALRKYAQRNRLPEPLAAVQADANLTDPEQVVPSLTRLLKGGCDGLIVASDAQAVVCLDVLEKMGVKVPAELSVISFGPPHFGVRARRPALALVDVDLEGEGRKAWERLKRLQAGETLPMGRLDWRLVPSAGPNTLRSV